MDFSVNFFFSVGILTFSAVECQFYFEQEAFTLAVYDLSHIENSKLLLSIRREKMKNILKINTLKKFFGAHRKLLGLERENANYLFQTDYWPNMGKFWSEKI